MISREEVKALAHLARLELPESEVDKLCQDLESILGYVAGLKVEATQLDQDRETRTASDNTLRPDTRPHESGIHTEQLLKASPLTRDGYLVVKPIFPQDD